MQLSRNWQLDANERRCGMKSEYEKVLALIEGIKGLGIEIRTKRNLQRLIGGQP
jgi:hypothetical protein